MRAPWALVAATAILLLTPAAPSQSLADRLADVHFPGIEIQVGGNFVEFIADRATVSGQTANDLRRCIDKSNCPDATIAQASIGNGNGQVEQREVEAFQDNLRQGLNFAGGNVSELREDLRSLVKIDDKTAASIHFARLTLDSAVGSIGSSNPIQLSLSVRGEFPDVSSKNTHAITFVRASAGLGLATRIIVTGASGWAVDGSTIEPSNMRKYYNDGKIEGTEQQFEDPQPLTFTLEKDEGSSLGKWLLFGALLLVIAAVAALAYARYQRRKA